jgi:hypothetical protein
MSAEQQSPVIGTIQALEDAGHQVAVAYHMKAPHQAYIHVGGESADRINKIESWAREAFDQGSEWVTVIVVSSPPKHEKNPRLTKPAISLTQQEVEAVHDLIPGAVAGRWDKFAALPLETRRALFRKFNIEATQANGLRQYVKEETP